MWSLVSSLLKGLLSTCLNDVATLRIIVYLISLNYRQKHRLYKLNFIMNHLKSIRKEYMRSNNQKN